MGMDVFGAAPSAPVGEYFRRNVWGWHPLAEMIADLFPEHYAKADHWHTNDGDGLDDQDAAALAKALREALDDGQIEAYISLRDAEKAKTPAEECQFCSGTGVRTDEVGVKMKQPDHEIPADAMNEAGTAPHPRAGETGWCNGCDGRGYRRPLACAYRLDRGDVMDFVDFLDACGGFRIC